MPNRFGFKDLVVIVLLLAIGLSVWLGMLQKDRQWEKLQEIQVKASDLERQIARLGSQLETSAGSARREIALSRDQVNVAPAAAVQTPSSRDTSWARPGVDISWQPEWTFATDPSTQPGFQPGGSFTEFFEVRVPKITPHIQTDVYGRRVVTQVAQPLADYDPKTLRLRGILADAWQMDPDGMWLRARLRDGVRFSDGVPVTAEDVRWTFHDFIMNPQIEAQRLRSIMADSIAKVEAISPRVVEFTFKQPLFNNADNALTFFILPKHFYERFSPSEINKATGLLMGSGPFRLARLDPENQWTPGRVIELVRNEQYWGPRPPLDAMLFQDITDELARLTAYRNGDGDMMTPAAPQFVTLRNDEAFAKNNQLLEAITMRSGRAGIIWNCGPRGNTGKVTPMHDPRVRRAMTMLLNREKMIQDIWSGVGRVAKGFMNPEFAGSDPAIKAWPYDPTAARALLKEAGWDDRDGNGVLENAEGDEFTFELTFFTGGEIAQRSATFVKDSYERAGIRVTLKGVDWSVGDPIRKQRDFDAMVMGWGANAPESDPKQIFHSDSIKDQGDNFGQWNSPRADAAIDALRQEVNFDKRVEHWREFDRAMHDEQPYTWVRLQPELRIIKPEIGNARQYPKGLEPWEFFRGAGPVAPSSGL